MTTEWKRVKLGDVAAIKHGWPFKSEFFSDTLSGKPIVVGVGNFRYSGGFRFGETATKEYLGDYPPQYELQPGDTLLVMTCQTPGGEILGLPGRVPADGRKYLHNQRLGRVELRAGAAASLDFLYWVFLGRDFNRELFASATGTKILHTAPSRIESYGVLLPPLDEQRAIAGLLGSLDNKIDINSQMNETLETMARALFKSWFVDFDPVRAKMEGRAPAGLDSETSAMFPDGFGVGDEHTTPAGWQADQLGSVLEWSRDIVSPDQEPDTVFEHYSLPAFDAGRMPVRELGSSIKSNKFRVRRGCVLFSKLNPAIERVWLPEPGMPDKAVCSTEFMVAMPRDVPRSCAYGWLVSDDIRGSLCALASGTSNSHQRVRVSDVDRIPIVRPPSALLTRYDQIASPIFDRIAAARAESQTLAALRDLLLPKLLSGELRIRDAERAVEAVL